MDESTDSIYIQGDTRILLATLLMRVASFESVKVNLTDRKLMILTGMDELLILTELKRLILANLTRFSAG